MDENLGREVEELNGIQYENMLSTYAEKRLEDGDIGLVPDVSDAAITNLEVNGTNCYHSGKETSTFQLGHDHETLLENAVVDSKTDNILESDSFVVLLANKEIRDSHCKYSDDGDEEGEDSSDDELLWFLIPVIVTVNLFCELFICIEKLSDTRDAETSNVHE
ncbi:MAG: hypothetical protein ASARMPRED_008336 [Alectoria sarmentosa]|nr:MAG: hypothetical protein ASARMPRED_008336 [Alectoria sarmentosa]